MSDYRSKFEDAQRNARKRDFENEKMKAQQDFHGVPPEEVEQAMKVLSAATGGKEVGFYIKKSPQSKVKFVQFIQDNWNYALENDFFTDEEILFLVRIQRFMQFKSNCLVDDIHSRSAVPMTQSQIAKKLKTDKSKVSRIVKSLMDKGVVVRTQGQKVENNNARTYALFINPNIIFSGERDKVEESLKAMFTNSKPILQEFPVALF